MYSVSPAIGVLCFFFPYPSTHHGVSEHAFPTIILFHHITLFPIRPSKPSCHVSVRVYLFYPTARVSFLSYPSSFVVDVSPYPPLLYFHPSSSSPFSMYIVVVVVVLHLRSLFPLALLSICFISPFFLLCMKWVVCTTMYAVVELEKGIKRNLSLCSMWVLSFPLGRCSDS